MPIGFIYRRANSRMRNLWGIRPPGTLFHIGELVAQRGDAAVAEFRGGSGHERVHHPGACAVRQDKAGVGWVGNMQQARDDLSLVHFDGEMVRFPCHEHVVPEFRP